MVTLKSFVNMFMFVSFHLSLIDHNVQLPFPIIIPTSAPVADAHTSYFLMEVVDDLFVLLSSNASFCFSPYVKFFQSAFLWFSAGIWHLLPPPTAFGDKLFEYRAALAHAWDASPCSLKIHVSVWGGPKA